MFELLVLWAYILWQFLSLTIIAAYHLVNVLLSSLARKIRESFAYLTDAGEFKRLAFVLAFVAIPVAEIVWVTGGGIANADYWQHVSFVATYFVTVAALSAISGVPIGIYKGLKLRHSVEY